MSVLARKFRRFPLRAKLAIAAGLYAYGFATVTGIAAALIR